MSSLREDIAKLLSETSMSGDEYIWATDAIMSAIDSHIPEKLNNPEEDGSWHHNTSHLKGFNKAVDLMREEMR